MFFTVRFTMSRSSPPVRNATHLRTPWFCLWRDFCQPACPFAARFTLKTALNSHDECNEFAGPFVLKIITWTIFYSLTFVDLNFHRIEVVTCSNLPTKPQAMLSFFNRIESPDNVSSFFLKMSAILFYGGIHCKPLKLCNKSRRSG